MHSTHVSSFVQTFMCAVTSLLCHCLSFVAICTIWVSVLYFTSPFSWHVVFCTLGIIPLLAHSVNVFSNNIWNSNIPQKRRYWTHAFLAFLGIVFEIIGIGVEIRLKDGLNESHLVSAHAIAGLVSMIFFSFALVSVPVPYTFLKIGRSMLTEYLELLHSISGQLAYITGAACLIFGFHTEWFKFYSLEGLPNMLTVATILGIIWSLILTWESLYYQLKFIRTDEPDTNII